MSNDFRYAMSSEDGYDSAVAEMQYKGRFVGNIVDAGNGQYFFDIPRTVDIGELAYSVPANEFAAFIVSVIRDLETRRKRGEP